MSENGPEIRPGDEIDLREIVSIVIDRWYWIAIGLVVSSLLGIGFALLQEREYRTEFRALSASSNQFNTLNQLIRVRTPDNQLGLGREHIIEVNLGFQLTPGQTISDLNNRLNSFQNFQSFVNRNPGVINLDEDQSLQLYFAERFSFNVNSDNRLLGSLTYTRNTEGPEMLNLYINETAEALWRGYLGTINRQNQTNITRLENQLSDQVESLLEKRQQRLFELRQAAAIANRLEIEFPTTPSQLGRQPGGSEVVYANISSGSEMLPLYFLGYQALEAEADILSESLNNGLMNEAIIQTQEDLNRQRRLARLIESSDFVLNTGLSELPPAERMVTVLDYALEPDAPSNQSQTLIVVISTFIGCLIGFMMTFISHFASKVREYRAYKAGIEK